MALWSSHHQYGLFCHLRTTALPTKPILVRNSPSFVTTFRGIHFKLHTLVKSPKTSPWVLKFSAVLDPELHNVLELATDAELYELSGILYDRSLLSPVLKSIHPYDKSKRFFVHDNDERSEWLDELESRFLFLAADAKGTVSGRWPRYRDVLLQVRRKLNVPCSLKLSTEDLEAEIFLHLIQEYTGDQMKPERNKRPENQMDAYGNISENGGRRKWRGYILASLRASSEELLSAVLKGGSALTMSTLQKTVLRKLGGKILAETARYQVAKELLKKGGQATAARLNSHFAVLAAKQGLVGAASRYAALRSTMMLLGPMLWGVFFADLAIRSVGTDYARVVRAIFALAQIRLTRTYGWTCGAQTDAELS